MQQIAPNIGKQQDQLVELYFLMLPNHAYGWLTICDNYRSLKAKTVSEGEGEGDIDIANTTCNTKDYLLYIA